MSKNYVPSNRGDTYFTPTSKINVKDEPVTPIEEDFGEHSNLDASIKLEYGGMRKSVSMSDIASLTSDLVKLECHSEHADHRHRRVSGTPELPKTKFVSMAESVYHYQRDTPDRFHSNPPRKFTSNGYTGPSGLTIPQSPMLRCRGRSRPHHILSQKEREEKEAEEIKKFKIKANPVPKSVGGCRNVPIVPKKLPTVPEPFHLTVVNKKLAHSPMPIPAFKARPAPKHILEKPQICPKQPIPVTKPVTPKFKPPTHEHNSYQELPKHIQKHEKPVRIGPVKPVPFSFEKRDEELKRRRDERIKKQLEEERKQACQFKAQPLPGAVKKRMKTSTVKCGSSSASSENKENRKFEARPPVVLYKEPFKPVLKPLQIVKPAPFQLNTEKRAAERERFDRTLKEKEDEQERLRQQREREIREAEEIANAELRAKLVHHPKPVPDTDQPFVPERSLAPITVPETPKCLRRLKRLEQREKE